MATRTRDMSTPVSQRPPGTVTAAGELSVRSGDRSAPRRRLGPCAPSERHARRRDRQGARRTEGAAEAKRRPVPTMKTASPDQLLREVRLEDLQQVVDRREGEEEAVEAVEQATVTADQRAEVLDVEVALEHALGEVAEWGGDADDEGQPQAVADAVPGVALVGDSDSAEHDERRHRTAEEALERLVRADPSTQRVATGGAADEQRADIVGHHAEGDEE